MRANVFEAEDNRCDNRICQFFIGIHYISHPIVLKHTQ